MVFMKWLGIVIVVLVVIVLAIKICTRNNDSEENEESSEDGFWSSVKKFTRSGCKKIKGRVGC